MSIVEEVSLCLVPCSWNSLPLTVCDVSLTLTQFCVRLKTFLFSHSLQDMIKAPLWQFQL